MYKLFFFFAFFSLSCKQARFTEFRGEDLGANRQTLAAGQRAAEKYCGSCHLTPLPESMSQDNAAFILAYMGLFHGIDAARGLDEMERTHFRQRFELLKKSGSIPTSAQITPGDWRALRAYYLGLARYPFESTETAAEIKTEPVSFADPGVTMLATLGDGRIAAGGATTGLLQFFKNDLSPDFSLKLDSPPVHISETAGGYFVLTLGSLLGALSDENKAALYFIDARSRTARPLLKNLPRSGHFIATDVNKDGKPDFLVAGFGAVTGGGILLFESAADAYKMKTLSTHASIVRLALLSDLPGRVEFLALAGGAREGLMHVVYENGNARERSVAEFAPHLGHVWLETADLDGDGKKEILVLSGDNADAGPYNETKPDQGLRIYTWDGLALNQVRFESAPGALALAVLPRGKENDIAITRFYAAPDRKQDLTLLRHEKAFSFSRRHLTLPSRPTVITGTARRLVLGSGNFPLLARVNGKSVQRDFSGPALFYLDTKLAEN